MQLRSGTSIASGSIATTKTSTQASGTQAKEKLSVIIEDYSSHSSKTSSQSTNEASAFMEGFGNMNLNAGFPMVDVALLGYDTRLVFVRENRLGAKLYSDHFNRIVVKIEDVLIGDFLQHTFVYILGFMYIYFTLHKALLPPCILGQRL